MEREGRTLTRISGTVATRPVRAASLLGLRTGYKHPSYKNARAEAHNQCASLVLPLAPQTSRTWEWNPVFPTVEERDKERNMGSCSNSIHHTSWGSEPQAIRKEGLWQKAVLSKTLLCKTLGGIPVWPDQALPLIQAWRPFCLHQFLHSDNSLHHMPPPPYKK